MGKIRVLRSGFGAAAEQAPMQPEAMARHSQRSGSARDPRQAPGSIERAPGRGFEAEIDLDEYTQIPAQYVLEFELGVSGGSSDEDAVGLRPEMFLLKRITWSSTGLGLARDPMLITGTIAPKPPSQDPPLDLNLVVPAFGCCPDIFGRSIKVLWGDEFTQFMGKRAALLNAIFGADSGFLDLTREVLFAGKQTLSAELERVFTLPGVTADQHELVQLVFHGTGLLPKDVHQSGSL